jgi:hypothetical protein
MRQRASESPSATGAAQDVQREDEQLNQLPQQPEGLQQNRLEQLRNDQELNQQQLQEQFNQTQQRLDELRR